MALAPPLLLAVAGICAVVVGPWLARRSVRLASHDERARPGPLRTGVCVVAFGGLVAGALQLTGVRPAVVALGWAAGAGLVLAMVDLAVHRLPDRVLLPALAACGTALAVDGVATNSLPAFGRALLAAVVAFGVAAGARIAAPAGLGFGDVKLLALIGLVLGWFGWGVLLVGVFFGLLTGAGMSLALLVSRRAGWRTAVPFGPPLLVGALLAIAVDSGLLGSF